MGPACIPGTSYYRTVRLTPHFARVSAAQLRMKFSLIPNVEIIEGDILSIDFDTLFGPKPGSTRPGIELTPETVHVLGNIPYYITSDILFRLFEFRRYFHTIVL